MWRQCWSFRAEKRSAQASAHLLSPAFVCLVLWEFWLRPNEIYEVRTFASCVVFSSLENYFGFRTTNVRVKTYYSVSLRWNNRVCIFLIIVHWISELILCPVLRLLSPGWIKTCLYSVISSYGYSFYMPRFIFLCRTSFILVFSQRTVTANACEWTTLCAFNF